MNAKFKGSYSKVTLWLYAACSYLWQTQKFCQK